METSTLQDYDLMQMAPSLESPWTVSSVRFDKEESRIHLGVATPS